LVGEGQSLILDDGRRVGPQETRWRIVVAFAFVGSGARLTRAQELDLSLQSADALGLPAHQLIAALEGIVALSQQLDQGSQQSVGIALEGLGALE
jgi:hypothetical protein